MKLWTAKYWERFKHSNWQHTRIKLFNFERWYNKNVLLRRGGFNMGEDDNKDVKKRGHGMGGKKYIASYSNSNINKNFYI